MYSVSKTAMQYENAMQIIESQAFINSEMIAGLEQKQADKQAASFI